ncbi:zinc ribbon domain-containing protein [Thermosynechococcus sp. GLH187]|uniref:zinc ribbon domain-containing protein n=1 Tax=unclassified Thermosynechococcus TaxID=2622553 RepID=UPI002877DE1F|nr:MULTISPECIES: zinc ribbon domain-containing protein [unclassified Thermosynechococcus]WNC43973.1 zinc ribbon domain-containing protein [Thermosynechococcus sp. GLH187]WNC46509.1 zinc ribbon domain-containing protein [Thermosynechococcus sp. GLH333]WNC49046.1 zinc ribbon domain-containing protein [Thermosynechococcus sp. GLH87]WNC51585.1 zinc ribbon domain-containing protein [Thermosynechococcus sp. TG215]WNC56666.1 zinc ribbon domain-containing protein [Thermosynechococcus sp. TG218]
MNITSGLRRLWRGFWRRSRLVNDEPLNWVSLIVIILVDIFILINVFSGLSEISNWPLSPSQAQPCYAPWQAYRQDTARERDIRFLEQQISLDPPLQTAVERLQESSKGKLGTISAICFTYAEYQDAVNRPTYRERLQQRQQKQAQIQTLEATNARIRQEYDSTLLEQLAGQPPDQSINLVEAAKAKATLEANNRQIAALKNEMAALEQAILQEADSQAFLKFLAEDATFAQLENQYQRSQFWYPSLQFVLQALFLLPLIAIALVVHRFADRHRHGLLALMSWHLLVILLIPLVLKIFELLQVGALFEWLANVILALFGGLLFLVSYLYILLIPAVGFGMIKVAQALFLNPQRQAAGRVQKLRCVRCGKRLRDLDQHCPHCGYLQWMPCPNCQQPTYRHLPYCRHCGASTRSSL